MARIVHPHLPQEIIAPVRRRDILATWMTVALLTGLANLLAIYLIQAHSPNFFDRLLTTKWNMLDQRQAPADALILGDSSGNQGVDPAILGAEVGGDWLNLCTVGNMLTVGSAWMLGDYIERFGPPERVLLVNVYDIWGRPAHPSAFARMPRAWGFWWRYDPALHFSPRQLAELTLARYAPLYAADVSLRQMIMHPWATFNNHPEIRDNGFMPMHEPWQDHIQEDYLAHQQRLRESSFRVSTPNRNGLERLLELAATHDFDIYYAHGPTYGQLTQLESFQQHFAELQAMLESVEKQHERFHLLFHTPQPFPVEQLQNVEHLTVQGARPYTRRIADAIEAVESGASGQQQ